MCGGSCPGPRATLTARVLETGGTRSEGAGGASQGELDGQKTKEPKLSGKKTDSPFSTIEEAIEDIRRGRMVVVCDDENRENEGDLTMAAQFATPEAVNFMATQTAAA